MINSSLGELGCRIRTISSLGISVHGSAYRPHHVRGSSTRYNPYPTPTHLITNSIRTPICSKQGDGGRVEWGRVGCSLFNENAYPLAFANDGDLGSYRVSSFSNDMILYLDLANGQYQVCIRTPICSKQGDGGKVEWGRVGCSVRMPIP